MTQSTREHKARLRARLLESRSALHPHQRRDADRRICVHLLRLLDDRDYLDVAAFVAFRGEPDLRPALAALSEAGRRIWMPVVDGDRMLFRRWRPDVRMRPNRYGIPEPVDTRACPPERLELVLAPLVAYSPRGQRLGMGAGYYDRTFEFAARAPEHGAWMVGVAYALQQVDSLPTESWDVPLGAVVTERGLQVFRE